MYVDTLTLIVFLVGVVLAALGAVAFTIAICRGAMAERRRRTETRSRT